MWTDFWLTPVPKKPFVLQPDKGRERSIAAILSYLRTLPEDRPWLVEIGKLVRERTNPQNRALFGHAYKILAAETGHDVNDLHNIFCASFFGSQIIKVLGYKKKKPMRTTTTNEDGERDTLNTEDFVRFFDHVQSTSAGMGFDIPDPDPMWRQHMAEEAAKEKEKSNETI